VRVPGANGTRRSDITTDITFGGGIVGRSITEDIRDGAVGVALHLAADAFYLRRGRRKFLLGFGVHERTDVSHYRHLGRHRSQSKSYVVS